MKNANWIETEANYRLEDLEKIYERQGNDEITQFACDLFEHCLVGRLNKGQQARLDNIQEALGREKLPSGHSISVLTTADEPSNAPALKMH